jgi:hypothetical protein
MQMWLALLFFLVLGSPALAQDLLSPAQFRDAGIALIRAQDPSAQIELRDELGINVRRDPSNPQSEFFLNFDNGYRDYRNSPERMTEILDRLVRLALTPPDATPTRERMVSVVRSRNRVEGYRAAYARMDPPSEIVARPLTGDLYEVIVYDSAEAVQFATRESLRDVGLTEDQAWHVARTNIPARMGVPVVSEFNEAPQGMRWVAGGNGLAPSALLRADVCAGTPGDLFLVPGSDGYWRADARDARALAFFSGFARHLISSGQSESSSVLTCRDDRLTLLAQ